MANQSQQLLPSYNYSYPLDLVTGAYAAYSVMKLRSAYTGYCMKVRRSSDDTTQDIGFLGNRLDTAAIATFIGGGNGFVDIWYDQSGNGRNTDSIATTLQPQINNRTQNGFPVLDFVSGQTVQCDALAAAVTGDDVPVTVFSVVYDDDPTLASAAYWYFSSTSTNTPIFYLANGSSGSLGRYLQGRRDDANTNSSVSSGTTLITSVLAVISDTFTGTTRSLDKNLTNVNNASSQNVGATTLNRLSIGARYSSSNYAQFFNGAIGSWILFNSALTSANKNIVRNTLIQNWRISA